MIAIAVAVHMLVLTTLDGRTVYVNPSHISSVSEAREETDPHKLLTGRVHCVLIMNNSKVITVEEDCDSIRQRMKGDPP